MVTKTGYVQSYRLELHESPLSFGSGMNRVYFLATISDDPAGGPDAEELVLRRDTLWTDVDEAPGNSPLAITYSNVQQAMIATLKDALARGSRVTVHYESVEIQPPIDPGAGIGNYPGVQANVMNAVEIQKP